MKAQEIHDRLLDLGIPIEGVSISDDGSIRVDYASSATPTMRVIARDAIATLSTLKKKVQSRNFLKIKLKELPLEDFKKLIDDILLELIINKIQREPHYAERLGVNIRGDK